MVIFFVKPVSIKIFAMLLSRSIISLNMKNERLPGGIRVEYRGKRSSDVRKFMVAWLMVCTFSQGFLMAEIAAIPRQRGGNFLMDALSFVCGSKGPVECAQWMQEDIKKISSGQMLKE